MQPLQRPQPQQQQLQQQDHHTTTNQLLQLQLPMESSSSFMDNHSSVVTNDLASNCMELNQSLNSLSGSAPSSPLSISSVFSSASSTETNTTPPSLGVNLRVTGQCSQGGRKYMEDFFSVAYQHSENSKDLEYAFFGIFDGHGGAEAASFAKEHLMMEIINQKLFWSDNDQDVLRAIREGYIATHFSMWRDQDKWPKTANGLPSTAGTTATVAFIRHEKIYIGHVGDSGIVLGYQNEGEKLWRARQLTVDHKPESVAERSRIMRSGGKVVVKSGVPRVVWNRPRNANHRGPIRHNTPVDEIPFLAVARSLGDLWSYNSMCNEFVVSPDPDVRVVKIDPKTFRCLVFGTDGLWNVVTPQEAVHTVYQNEFINELLRKTNAPNETNWKNPSQSLVCKALNYWSAKKMRADNTSVVTVILHPPNDSCNDESIDNLSDSTKLENQRFNDCFNMEHMANHANSCHNDTITYHEMAEKYLPPTEYQNFNYYDDGLDCNVTNVNQQKSYYVDRYATKMTTHSRSRYPVPTTIESLEFMCGNKEMERIVLVKNHKSDADVVEALKEIDIKIDNTIDEADVDDDDTDEEDCDEDMCDNVDDEDEVVAENEIDRTHEHDETTISMSNSHEEYATHFKELSSTNSTSSSYMSTLTESYNTLLNDDGEMSGDVSTSNSSNSYKSHCATNMHELMQEQQRYQQQCMSEEEGYSLTKLETRREQQRCQTGVQTFRIFQQHQQQQQEVSTQTANNIKNVNCEEAYIWPRYTSQQTPAQTFELNSLLQQEREEEQQVELERQMELERLQKQQQQQEYGNATTIINSNLINSNVVCTPVLTNCSEQPSIHDVTIDEEYLLEDLDDTTVQINEISSSSSCLTEMNTLTAKTCANLKLTTSSPLVSPMPSSSTSRESNYEDALETSSSSSSTSNHNEPKFIEKLEKIEILHEKPELVIETTSPSMTMMATRSRHKAKIINKTTTPNKRRMTTKPNYRNVPNENRQQQHQQQQQIEQKSNLKSTNSTLLRLTSIKTPEVNIIYNKRQLRSTSNNSGGSAAAAPININNFNGNRRSFCLKPSLTNSNNGNSTNSSSRSSSSSSSNSSLNTLDYVKRTLRTRNVLSKDLKAKTTLVASTLKRTTTNVTSRFLRTQAVNILNMQQNTQIFVKESSTSAQQQQQKQQQQHQHQQQQQRPLSATTLNFINLRSRQISGACVRKNVINCKNPTVSNVNLTGPAASSLTQSTNSPATSTPYVKRNLRSLNGKLKLTASNTTTTTGLPNYCKSMRSQSTAALITPPPPSPKYFNGTNSHVNAALTRARTANVLYTAPTTTTTATTSTSTTAAVAATNVLNSFSNRKRSARNIEQLSLHATTTTSSLTNPRSPKRLKR